MSSLVRPPFDGVHEMLRTFALATVAWSSDRKSLENWGLGFRDLGFRDLGLRD